VLGELAREVYTSERSLMPVRLVPVVKGRNP
jgi:hypothetical protein